MNTTACTAGPRDADAYMADLHKRLFILMQANPRCREVLPMPGGLRAKAIHNKHGKFQVMFFEDASVCGYRAETRVSRSYALETVRAALAKVGV